MKKKKKKAGGEGLFRFFQTGKLFKHSTKEELGAVFMMSLESGKVDQKVCADETDLSHFTAWVRTVHVQSAAKWALDRVCVYTRASCVTRVEDLGELSVCVLLGTVAGNYKTFSLEAPLPNLLWTCVLAATCQ